MENEKCRWWEEAYDRIGLDVAKTPVEKEICRKLRNGESIIAYMKETGYTMEELKWLRSRILKAERNTLCVKSTSIEMEKMRFVCEIVDNVCNMNSNKKTLDYLYHVDNMKEKKMYKENLYLIYKRYGIMENEKSDRIIVKAAYISYLDFRRKVFFQQRVPMDGRDKLQKETTAFLSDKIPYLLNAANDSKDGQETFDKIHHEICGSIIQIYDNTDGNTYGIAQRWLNLTLMNLIVLEENLKTGYWPLMDTRKYFHASVDQYLLEVATSKSNRFKHGLKLKYAPLKHDNVDEYHMDWHSREKTQPYQCWGYQEYMEFQIAVRNKLKECLADQTKDYRDCLDWSFQAFMEGAQSWFKY